MLRKTSMAIALAVLAVGAGHGVDAFAATLQQSGTATGRAAAPMLPQPGNPANGALNGYKHWLSTKGDSAAALAADKTLADNIITWQMPHGGFYKLPAKYAAPWDGKAPRSGWIGNGVELGTIDNDGTVSEIRRVRTLGEHSLPRQRAQGDGLPAEHAVPLGRLPPGVSVARTHQLLEPRYLQ
jgi:hypothetical protein